jgi:hypothetical protein
MSPLRALLADVSENDRSIGSGELSFNDPMDIIGARQFAFHSLALISARSKIRDVRAHLARLTINPSKNL